ncbi:hypothetical protein BOTBODRAFT_320357 [Botryobasidium botryosum FD-172 SS1]|uniref:Uncharacterized protein n=1 Tax=Botryobasidium botryosum (strain FD-172 SS1) TaxID=930990 RepID=A0A067MYP7_BOTB1|nr:hypothetical protein BOTBODRAFT_320357 [Botryobasidium botryosum FD-172 SS1]
MNTRRRSRQLAAAAATAGTEGVEQDTSSQYTVDLDDPASSLSAKFSLSFPSDFPLERLKSYLPAVSLAAPTQDDILSVYKYILDHGAGLEDANRALDESRAEVVKKEVELDQALQDHESIVNELRSSVEDVTRELAQVKLEKSELAAVRSTLESQLGALNNNQSSSSAELDALRRRVEDSDREKRDLVSVVNRMREDGTRREEEIDSLRLRLKETRSELLTVQSELTEIRSGTTTAQFQRQTLEQEVELLKGENQRYKEELDTLLETSSKDRREKHASLVQLQSQYDSLSQTHESKLATLQSLQKAHIEQTQKLTQTLQKVSELESDLAEQAASFRNESATQARLNELHNRRNEQLTNRLKDVEQEWEKLLSKAEDTEERLKEQAARERQRGDEFERKYEEMRTVVEKFGTGEFIPGGLGGSVSIFPGTPGVSGTPRTPGSLSRMSDASFALSPTAHAVSQFQKGGKSYTEVYAEYVRVSDELVEQKKETRRLEEALQQVLADIQERAPIIANQREEYYRMAAEVSQLARALEERDEYANQVNASTNEISRVKKENALLQRQLSDLARQVQGLTHEISIRDNPSLASVEFDDAPTAPDATDSDRVITDNLVLFKSLPALQEQNQRLLRTARSLAAQWEEREEAFKAELAKEESAALAEAMQAVQEMEEELQRQKTIAATHQKERDMYRSMLARRGRGEDGAGAMENGIEHLASSTGSDSGPNYKQLLEEQTKLFDAFKLEMGVDAKQLKEDLLAAQREAGNQSANLAKAKAQIEFLNERMRINQSSAEMQARETASLQKRNDQLQTAVNRAELAMHHSEEALSKLQVQMERSRNENANLRAEKDLWKSIEARLTTENKELAKERAHLSDLMRNVQTMQAELERSSDNDKRRLASQLEALETQNHDLRTQLSKEHDNIRHISLQRDLESKELRERIDRVSKELATAREAQLIAETSQKHLQTRVDDLVKQREMVEEKLSTYQRRSSLHVAGEASTSEVTQNVEQELQSELAELRATLKAAEIDLESARSHVEQYKAISQASEEALSSMNATFDQFKLDTEKQLATKTAELESLQVQQQSIQEQLMTLSNENTTLHQQLESQRISFEKDKKLLEETIADLSTVEERAQTVQVSVQDELRKQAELAQLAHEKYEKELMAHAEAVKTVSQLKQQLADAQAQARDNHTAAETARANQLSSEASWKSQKETIDKEMSDLNARCRDLTEQNSLLHKHLETVNDQATRIRQAADSASANLSNAEIQGASDDTISELRAVISFIRQEKDILELQLDLNKQENSRLKSHAEQLARSLDESRAHLSKERERAAQSAASTTEHEEHLKKIEQLNILHESNTQLRSKNENNEKRITDLEAKLKQATAQLEPVQAQVRATQAELESRLQQLKLAEEDNQRWKSRTQQILQKHERIDPTELQKLKETLEKVGQEKAELETQLQNEKTAPSERQSRSTEIHTRS